MSRSRALVVGAVVAAGSLAAACGSSPNVPVQSATDAGAVRPSAPVGAVVTLAHVSFGPSRVTITAGQAVEWVWNDAPIPHNVTFSTFASPTQTTGVYYHTFDSPGVYRYRCTIHPSMFGTVTVRPSS